MTDKSRHYKNKFKKLFFVWHFSLYVQGIRYKGTIYRVSRMFCYI